MNASSDPQPDVHAWLEHLQAGGYRLTGARRAVVETIASTPYALDPGQIYQQAHAAYPRLGLVTVYRTLEKLEALGLIQRVHRADGCNAYIANQDGHQHLLICTQCGRAEYFSGDDLESLIRAVEQERGYQIQGHWLQLYGLCSACQPRRSPDKGISLPDHQNHES